MARTLRASVAVTNAGLAAVTNLSAVDASASPNGETCPYGSGHKLLHVKSTGTPATVTITDDEGIPNAQRPAVVLAATADTFILLQTNPQTGLLQGGGNILINYSVATGLSAEILDVAAE